MTPQQENMIARLIAEIEYLRDTHDVRDSIRNEPTLTQDARAMFNLPAADDESEAA